jgi:hypothetical protein
MATLPTPSSSLGAVFLASVVLFFVYSHVQDKRRNPAGLPYPPGPKGYPIIGNLFDIPNAFIYKRFREMSRELSEGPFHTEICRSAVLTNRRMQILISSTFKCSRSISSYATPLVLRMTFLISGRPSIRIGNAPTIAWWRMYLKLL